MEFSRQSNCRAALTALHASALLCDQLTQAFQIFCLRPLTGQLHQRDLGQAPGMKGLAGLLDVWRGYPGPMIGAQDNDLLLRQLRQHLANDAAAHTQHLPQAFFGEAAGRDDALLKNGIEDSRVDVIHRGLLATGAGEGQGRECLAVVRR
ncbi:hypothetical protein A1D17_18555 [Pseudomonas fluorescens]|uniref:Uncharacterized protein n=1 Tax=Pseudomonas fluorescens TaxID=294 RepID=A0A166NY39_PSEFL|nr:hypothetical protein A1D17_18555 [Pseudomonas fluorescens]